MTGGEGRLDLKSGVAATVVVVEFVVVVYCKIVEVVDVKIKRVKWQRHQPWALLLLSGFVILLSRKYKLTKNQI